MTVLITAVVRLLDRLSTERDHAKATVLAFRLAEQVPGLVAYTKTLEGSLGQAFSEEKRKHTLDFECHWCGEPFKVYFSEIQQKKRAGKFCCMDCSTAYYADLRENSPLPPKRKAERKVEAAATSSIPEVPASGPQES